MYTLDQYVLLEITFWEKTSTVTYYFN